MAEPVQGVADAEAAAAAAEPVFDVSEPEPPASINPAVITTQDSTITEADPAEAAVTEAATEPPPVAMAPQAPVTAPDAYKARLQRAKTGKLDAPPEIPKATSSGFSLDLSSLPKQAPASGEHKLGDAGQTLTTPRAKNEEEVLTVRGAPKHKQKQLFRVGPDILGEGRFKFAWRPGATDGGVVLATASTKGGNLVVNLFKRDGAVANMHTLGGGRCLWLEWDSKGQSLGILQENAGIFLWDLPQQVGGGDDVPTTVPMSLAPSITTNASFCKWSKVAPQLAIGTHQGKVIIFNKGEGVMQLHEKKGKHGAPVTCGDWLFDNRLGLASGLRVKISQPIAETGSKWESYSKFRLGGMLSKVPRHIRVAGDPNRLAFTLNYPPFVAVSVGDKYLLTFDTTRVNEDLGLTFPEDYGVIAAFQWLPNLVLLVGLTNGYMVTVDFGALIKLQQSHKLPDRVSAMGTSKVFNEYLQDVSAFYTANTGQRVACCGDTLVKIVHRTGVELEVHLEVQLDRTPTIGNFLDKVEWDDNAKSFACSATDGYLYVHELLD